MTARTPARLALLIAGLVGLSGWGVAAHAGDRAPVPQADGAVWLAVSDRQLDTQRGGFDTGAGLMVSFGITRAIYINGALITETTLNFGRIADLTPSQAAQLSQQMSALNLVQNGPGNIVQPNATGAAIGTIIQNTLNNQHIVNQTVINASSNAMGMIKNLNTESTLADTLSRAAAPR